MEFVRAGAGARMVYRRPTIYFDWDGTLADSMPLCIAHIRQTLEELGLPPKTNAETAKCNGPNLSGVRAGAGHPGRYGRGLSRNKTARGAGPCQ